MENTKDYKVLATFEHRLSDAGKEDLCAFIATVKECTAALKGLQEVLAAGGTKEVKKAKAEEKVVKAEEIKVNKVETPWGEAEEEVTYTLEDARAALQDLAKKKGREYAKSFLSDKFGAKRISDLPEKDYARFIEAVGGELNA